MVRSSDNGDGEAGDYSTQLGDRIRVIRRQKRLSLQDVEARSDAEFKASVLGAYERGERAVSVPRLHRLAEFYNVPVDQLLPPLDARTDAETGGTDESSSWTTGDKVIIDLVALGEASGPQVELTKHLAAWSRWGCSATPRPPDRHQKRGGDPRRGHHRSTGRPVASVGP